MLLRLRRVVRATSLWGVVVGLLVFTSGGASALSEVWVGDTSGDGRVQRYDMSGNLLGAFDNGWEISALATIPEPSTALLLGVGLAGLGMRRRSRRRC